MTSRYGKKRSTVPKHSETFKLHVVKTVLQTEITYRKCAQQFNISYGTLLRWVRKYHNNIGEQTAIDNTMTDNSPSVPAPVDPNVKQLQQALEDSSLTITALNALIDLAEATYKIDIRKNSGTKQQDC